MKKRALKGTLFLCEVLKFDTYICIYAKKTVPLQHISQYYGRNTRKMDD